MAGADLQVSTSQNKNTAPFLTNGSANPAFVSAALGAITDTGAAQETNDLEIQISGVSGDGTVIDVLDSADGTNFTQLQRIYGGGASQVVKSVSRYLRLLTQYLPNGVAPIVQWSKATAAGSSPGGTSWLTTGNPTGPGVLGTMDGSMVTVGGLSAASALLLASGAGAGISIGAGLAPPGSVSGELIANTAAGFQFQTAGVAQILAGGGGMALTGGGPGGMTIASGVSLSTTSNQVQIDAASTVLLGSVHATTVTVGNSSADVSVEGSSILFVGGTGTNAWTVAAGGILQLASDANAHIIDIGTGAAIQVINIGSTTDASSLTLLFGVGGCGLGVNPPGSGGIQIDTPSGGVAGFGTTNADTIDVGNASAQTNITGSSTLIHGGALTLTAGSSGMGLTATGGPIQIVGQNIALGAPGSFGSGTGVFFLANDTVDPTTNPTGGGILFVSAGALKYRGPSGVVTPIAVA